LQAVSDITIIIPCYSWPRLFPEALASIQAQTVKPYMVILAIDGTNPEKYRGFYVDGFELVESISPQNQGIAKTLNSACLWAYQTSEWFLRLDEDDTLHPRALEFMLLSSQLCPERAIHYSDWVKVGDWRGYMTTPEYSFERLCAGPFMTSASLVRTDVWKAVQEKNGVGFDPDVRGWEDYLFFLEAGALGYRGARVGLGLLNYRKHAGQSRSDEAHSSLSDTIAYIKNKMKRVYDVEVAYEFRDGLR
jgi:glycosyltransferase involved in cell wall biosynthesis